MFCIKEVDQRRAIISFEEQTRITGKASERFRQWCEENGVEKYRLLVIDGINLDFIDSMGIASVIRLFRLISTNHGKLILTRLSQDITEVLSTLRLDSLLDVREDDPSELVKENI